MTIPEQLQQLSLSKSEVKIYLFLLEHGLASPPQIAKATGIARTNVYNILSSLKAKELTNEQPKGTRKVYLVNDPQALLRNIQKKEEIVSQLLPDLKALYTTQKNKPKIQFYDGFEQVKEIYWRTTDAESKKLFAIGSTKTIVERDKEFFLAFEKRLRDNGVLLRDLITDPSQIVGTQETKQILKSLYDFQTLPAKYADFPTDMLFWDDHIALITLVDPIFGTVVTNERLAKTFSYIFEMIWNINS